MFYDAKNSFCRSLELISKQTMPVRLKLAKLSKKLVAVEERWEKNCAVTDVDAVDPVEIKLENQVGLKAQRNIYSRTHLSKFEYTFHQ